MRQDLSKGKGQYNQYWHFDTDFFNIIQLLRDIEWIISDDEAHKKDIFTGENVSWAFKINVKATVIVLFSQKLVYNKLTVNMCLTVFHMWTYKTASEL